MVPTVERERSRPHVAHLRIDHGELNLLTVDEVTSIRTAIEEVSDEVSVLTIAAAESEDDSVGGLTAGLDLEWARDRSSHQGHDLLREIYRMTQAVRDLEAVTVCGCGDYALGAGFELALGCEFRVATEDATLGLPEVNVGLPTVIHGGLLIRLAGVQTANELIYTGKTIDGTRASELGLVNRAVCPSDYAGAMAAIVDTLAAKSPAVLTVQKRVMKRYRSLGFERGMEASIGDIGRVFGTPDQREAMDAFLEGRDPNFASPSGDD